jgi:heterodisulfide reductase subunit A
MITLTINGQKIQAQEGQTVLEVCRKNNVAIPTLCYHPVLEPYGSCRMCTVEVARKGQSWSTLQTACTHPAWDGLEVQTDSPAVREVRRTLLELFLSRAPKVPVIQELAAEYGVFEPPFPVENPDEKCILCGLCVRVCNDMVKAHVLNFSQRGIDRVVGPPFMEKTRQCIGCGACTIVCPTGAIDIILEQEAIYAEKPLGPTASIYVPSLQAVPRVPVIDTDTCIRFRQRDRSNGEIDDACGACQMLCEAGAIDFTQQDEIVELNVGAVVVATGFQMWDATRLTQYSYGKSPNIITGLEFERLSNASGPTAGQILTADGVKPEKVAIVHCVGSRDVNAHEYCSRICCMYSLKQAHLVRDKTHADVYEFYMDMRAFGKGYEEFYERVQEEGVVMVRGRGAEVQVLPSGKLRVTGEDANLGKLVAVDVDMVVLSTAIEPPADASKTAQLFGLGRTPDGWFAEAHPKLRPVETNTDGVFLAGVAQSPKDVPDTVAHAGAAASMVLALLNKGEVTISPQTAFVNEDLCSACKTCLSVCPYTAISFIVEDNVVRVNEALCKGCGTCVASCPAGAIQGRHFTDDQIMAQIEGLFRAPAEAPLHKVAEEV